VPVPGAGAGGRGFLLRSFGSGRYLLIVKGRNKLLRKHVVTVHNQRFPPQVDESEVVVADPRNDSYFKAWGKKQNGAGRSDKEPSAQTDVNTVLEKTGSFDPKARRTIGKDRQGT
jgi:hypothetical protein